MSTDSTTLRDMMGNELRPGDTFVYAALQNRSVGMRAGKVRADGKLHVVSRGCVRRADGSWGRGWSKMNGRPSFDQLVKVPEECLSADVRSALE